MAVQKQDFDAEDAQEESAEEISARQETERQAELDQERNARHEAEVAKAKAEGEAEAFRRGITARQETVTPWSDDQWEQEGQKRGMTGQAYKAMAELAGGIADFKTKEAKESSESAKREAAELRAELKKLKSGMSLFDVERDFYDKNPELAGRKGDVAEFMDLLPEESKNDPKKFLEAMNKAKVYVRGKVRETANTKRASTKENLSRSASERQDYADDNGGGQDDIELDTSDLDNEGSRRLVQELYRRPGGVDLQPPPPALDELTIEDAYKASERSDKRGVSIDERGEFSRGSKRSNNALKDTRRIVKMTDEERDKRDRKR